VISRRFFPASCFSCFSFFLGWAESFCLLFFFFDISFVAFNAASLLRRFLLPLCCGDLRVSRASTHGVGWVKEGRLVRTPHPLHAACGQCHFYCRRGFGGRGVISRRFCPASRFFLFSTFLGWAESFLRFVFFDISFVAFNAASLLRRFLLPLCCGDLRVSRASAHGVG
jgi:hypothetical protein